MVTSRFPSTTPLSLKSLRFAPLNYRYERISIAYLEIGNFVYFQRRIRQKQLGKAVLIEQISLADVEEKSALIAVKIPKSVGSVFRHR